MAKNRPTQKADTLIEALKQLLQGRKASTQESLCISLERQGFAVNQSKVSRLLRKVGAVKAVNSQGDVTYSLAREPVPPVIDAPLESLIVDILANETMVVIFTSPGCASLMGRVLDYNQPTTEILATIAGDDTVFVAPKSIKNIDKLFKEIKALFKR